jgi:hypothetical protein
LTEQPSARPTAFTSASGNGSFHATAFAPPGRPFSRVGVSLSISASAAMSFVTCATARA